MVNSIVVEQLEARGHPNIKATHRSTFEITRDRNLTPRGDCIIAVAATKAAADFDPRVKYAVKSRKRVTLILVAEELGVVEVVRGLGHPALTLNDPRSIVVRKSWHIDDRTVAVHANKAAQDLDRRLIAYLKQPGAPLKVYIIVHDDVLDFNPLHRIKNTKNVLISLS